MSACHSTWWTPRGFRRESSDYENGAQEMRTIIYLGLALAPLALYGQGQPPLTCGGLTTCYEAQTFLAAITDFRAIVQGTNNKTLTARISFRNKTNRPLILGYVQGSGVGTDDRGNRYVPYGPQAVRGIGEI